MPDRRRHAAVLARSRRVRRHDPREAVLDALVQVVARRGYERTTLAEVLALARVPEPVFAEHFEDKRDCLLAALDRSIARLGVAIELRVDPSAPWPQRIGAGLRALLSGLAERPQEASLICVECLAAGDPASARLRRALASAVPELELGRREGAGAGSEADPGDPAARARRPCDMSHLPALTSEALVGGIASILHRRVLNGEIAELPELLPDLLYFALMPYLGHERALALSRAG